MNAIVADNTNDEISSLLIPMAHCKLVLPTVSVAEMIPYQSPQTGQLGTTTDVPDWLSGSLAWRGIQVPMVSFELLNTEPAAQVKVDSHIIILNTTGVSSGLNFICMVTQGIPRLKRVTADGITEIKDAMVKEYWQMEVHLLEEKAVIPDIAKIERACVSILG